MSEKCDTSIQEKSKKDIDHKHIFLRQIHTNPKNVQIHDLETDEVVIYPSIYKAAWPWFKIPALLVCIMEK